jgi:hypothetical protein
MKRREEKLEGDDAGLIAEIGRGGASWAPSAGAKRDAASTRPALAPNQSFYSKPNRQNAGKLLLT